MSRSLVRTLSFIPALVVVAGVLSSAPAEAKGIIVYNHGPDYYPTGPLPAPWNETPELQGFEAAYVCETFGLFWANLAWWDCQPILLNHAAETYLGIDDVPPELGEAIQTTYTQSDMQMGAWTEYGRWLFLLLILGVVALKLFGASEEEGAPAPPDEG